MNVPSNPPGWTAGKWGEWYPDLLGADGKLSVEHPKPYWQQGWLTQHDRLMQALSMMPERIPIVVSGDLHAIGEGRMLRSGQLDFSRHPVIPVLPGPLGTSDGGWASEFRGVGPLPPKHLDMQETVRADRGERLSADGFHTRDDYAALFQVESEDPAHQRHRQA